MSGKRLLDRCRQHRVSPLPARTTISLREKIDILDSKAATFHQSQSGPIKQNRHQTRHAVHVIDHFLDLFLREYDRQPQRPLCTNDALDKSDLFAQHVLIKKYRRALARQRGETKLGISHAKAQGVVISTEGRNLSQVAPG